MSYADVVESATAWVEDAIQARPLLVIEQTSHLNSIPLHYGAEAVSEASVGKHHDRDTADRDGESRDDSKPEARDEVKPRKVRCGGN